MKITFLGTNGWYSTPTGDTSCILIDTAKHYLVLDAGNGIYKLDQYIKEDKPISMFISHFHLDHVSGLHTLTKFAFKQGIDVYVGTDRSKDFETLVNPPYTIGYKPRPDNVGKLKTEIRLHELSEEGQNIPFKAYAIKQHHAYIDHGFRFELEGKTIAYTGDCGFTDKAIKLAKNSDLLISECAAKDIPEEEWGHLNATQAATLAKESNVNQLILTHFGAHLYTSLNDRKLAETQAQKIFPRTIAAIDLFEFEL